MVQAAQQHRVVDCTWMKVLTMVAAARACVCVGRCLISRVSSNFNSVAIMDSSLGKWRYAHIDIKLMSLVLRVEMEPGSHGFLKALVILCCRWSYLS